MIESIIKELNDLDRQFQEMVTLNDRIRETKAPFVFLNDLPYDRQRIIDGMERISARKEGIIFAVRAMGYDVGWDGKSYLIWERRRKA